MDLGDSTVSYVRTGTAVYLVQHIVFVFIPAGPMICLVCFCDRGQYARFQGNELM